MLLRGGAPWRRVALMDGVEWLRACFDERFQERGLSDAGVDVAGAAAMDLERCRTGHRLAFADRGIALHGGRDHRGAAVPDPWPPWSGHQELLIIAAIIHGVMIAIRLPG